MLQSPTDTGERAGTTALESHAKVVHVAISQCESALWAYMSMRRNVVHTDFLSQHSLISPLPG